MAKVKADTREQIQDVALELFATNGFEATSLREIAERLGMTKAALYYHFPSKQGLLLALAAPLLDDIDAMLERVTADPPPPRRLLEECFDLSHRHRVLYRALLTDMAAMGRTDIVPRVIDWRTRITDMVIGSATGSAALARATLAMGGLQDCVVVLHDVPVEEYRTAAIDAAVRALGD